MPLQCLKLVSNETFKDASIVRHQKVSVVRFHDVAQERCGNVPKASNDIISRKSQIKDTVAPLWYPSTMHLNHVAMIFC